jgi:hypothetical protein
MDSGSCAQQLIGKSSGKDKNGFAGSWNFNSPNTPPSQYKLATKEIKAVETKRSQRSVLVRFWRGNNWFCKAE